MTISRNVYNQLFEQVPTAAGQEPQPQQEKVIRLRPTEAKAGATVVSAKSQIRMWTKEEHEKFLEALEKFPSGPWKKVADHIGTKTPRQTMTHAQKYRQKIHRRQRGLRNQKKSTEPNKNSSNAVNGTTPSSPAAPSPVDTKADVNFDGKAIVSPYGVADLQLKQETPKSAEAAATNVQLLNILAQQATTMQGDAPTKEVETATNVTVDATDAAQAGQNLPSLAEILHLSGSNGEEGEEKEPEKEKETQEKTEKRPTECKCSCKCGAHDVKMEGEETTTQPRPQEALI